MLPKFLLAGAALLATAAANSEGLTCHCDPTKESCAPNPALGNEKIDCDLTKKVCDQLKPLDGTYITKFSDKGALFSIEKDFQGPTLVTEKFIMYGRTDITFQAAPGAGIVSSIVFMSCDRDEIDWELVGNYDYQIQTNFFSQGNETTYGRGRNHTVENPINVAHTYSVEWTRHKIDWLIDDVVVRTEKASDSKDGYGFPQTPSQVKFGIWVGGNANANPDAMNWAGGKADFKNAPFNAYLKHVKVVDYAGGDGPSPNKVDSYSYGDRSGSFESIKYLPAGSGNVGGGKPNKAAAAAISASSASASSSSAQPTATGDKTSTMVKPSTSSGASESASSTDAASTTQTTTASVAQTTTKSAGSRIGAGVGAVVLAALAALL